MSNETYCIIRLNDLKSFFKLNFLHYPTLVIFHIYIKNEKAQRESCDYRESNEETKFENFCLEFIPLKRFEIDQIVISANFAEKNLKIPEICIVSGRFSSQGMNRKFCQKNHLLWSNAYAFKKTNKILTHEIKHEPIEHRLGFAMCWAKPRNDISNNYFYESSVQNEGIY